MAESSKRNLLYGMFAWRMGYIDRQQLSKALQESADSEIGSVLVDLGIINEQSRAEIDRLLLDQINRHNGDEEASLASLRHDKETTNEFKDETPANLSLPLDNTDNPVFPLQPITTEVSRGEFHAKGGLGRIYRSTDVSLQREVAVKQIDERFADVDEAQERFRREAMVTSQLQHPGVVPVYGLGVDQSGRPYYTMRFVEGVHFGEKISQFHSPAIDYRSVEFLELLDCVVDAAQTVRYAHSKGIVHRDLKPANILVGKFGETVVIDWGLAKILSEPGPEIFVGEIEGGEGTREGQILGTPGYAAPEQLRGDHSSVDQRTDVFGLGAVLFQLLTGESPVSEAVDPGAAMEEIKSKDFALADGLAPVARPLFAIAHKAMRPVATERYEAVDQFIEEVNRWKADLPVLAAPETFAQKLSRLGRKHQRVILGTAASLFLISVISVFSLYFMNQARIAEFDQRSKAEKLVEEKSKLVDEKTSLAARNKKVADRFVKAFENADPKNKGVTNRTTALEVLKKFNNQTLINTEDEDPITTATLLKAAGNSMFRLGAFSEALESFEKAAEIFTAELGSANEELLSIRTNIAACMVKLARYPEANEILGPLVAMTQKLGLPIELLLERKNDLASTINFLGRYEEARQLYQEIVDQYEELGVNNLEYWSSVEGLASTYERLGKYQESVNLLEQALENLKRLEGDDAPATLAAMGSLVRGFNRLRRTKDAIRLGQQAVDLNNAKFGIKHVDTLIAMGGLADAYERDDQDQRAIDTYLKVLQVGEPYLGKDHQFVLAWKGNLADAYRSSGQRALASDIFKEVYETRLKSLGDDNPSTLLAKNNYGTSLRWIGKFKEAIQLLQETLEGRKVILGPEHPMTISTMSGLYSAYNSDGQYSKALDMIENLVDVAVKVYGPKHDRPLTYGGDLANCYRVNGMPEKAVDTYRKQLVLLDEKFTHEHSFVLNFRNLFAETLISIGAYEEAEQAVRIVIGALRDSDKLPKELQRAVINLAQIHVFGGEAEKAIDLLQSEPETEYVSDDLALFAKHYLAFAKLSADSEDAKQLGIMEESTNELGKLLGGLTPIKRGYVEQAMKNTIEVFEKLDDQTSVAKWRKRLTDFRSELKVD